MYIASHKQNIPVTRKTSSPKTKNIETSRAYFLNNTNGIWHTVCLKFFLLHGLFRIETLNLLKKSSNTGLYTGYDRRRDNISANATSDEVKQFIREHIDAYPQSEYPHCRRDSTKHYLAPDLHLSLTYKIYKHEFCIQKGISAVSEFVCKKKFFMSTYYRGFCTYQKISVLAIQCFQKQGTITKRI